MPTLSTIGAACARAWGFTSGLVKDQYFNLVSLLLPGNGTNGAQNNTFLDGSSNNFTITRNGNTTQGTFSPFSQTGWGAYFDGSNDFLSVADTAAIQLSTGDFTIECWVNVPNTSSQTFITKWTAGSAGYYLGLSASNTIGFYTTAVSGGVTASFTTANQWVHIAAVRSGNTYSLYVDGSSVGTPVTTASSNADGGSALNIGRNSGNSGNYVTGYISNVRIVKGVAVYTGNFTPPIAPLTATQSAGTNISAITGTQTSLLTCQSNRFVDNSSTPLTITPNNGTAITPFAPFAPTQSYSASAVGGSGYFDGTVDYLSIASNAAFQFGAGNFTLEAWVYLASYNGSLSNMIVKKYTAAFPTCEFLFQIGSTGQLSLAVDDASNETFITTATSVVPVGAWAHCVATRSGSALRLFVNGKLVKYGTTALTIVSTSTPVEIGNNIIGNIGGLRIFKGSIPTDYQTSSTTEGTQIFTPPTAPLTTTSQGGSSPSLLLNFTNAGVVDATAKNVLETVGNAQISTTGAGGGKWGGGSISIPGSSYLFSNSSVSDLCAFGTGDFCIEFWLYFSSTTGTQLLYDGRPSGVGTGVYIAIYKNASQQLGLYVNGADRIVGATTVTTGQWYHVALARASGNTRLYLAGNQQGSTYSDTNSYLNGAGRPAIGAEGAAVGSNSMNGYIDDLRVTKGNARGYTGSTITVPSAPFPLQ